jgi:hypothetical protein|tara:strand:+ start:3829 stop:4284 length:456 start_codon:yes stop_codon:yes gene_type:complete
MEQQIDRCGDCHSCCKSFGSVSSNRIEIIELGIDYKWSRCNKLCDNNRCTIYSTRPQTCTDFECVYVESNLPEEYLPDTIGYVTDLRVDNGGHFLNIIPHESGKSGVTPTEFWKNNYKSIHVMKTTAEEVWSVVVHSINIATASGSETFNV